MSSPYRKVLLPHEVLLLDSGRLTDVTHPKSSSCILRGESADATRCSRLFDPLLPKNVRSGAVDAATATATASHFTTVYRPVGDVELNHLLEQGLLPDTQPYHAIMEGEAGRSYAEKFVFGSKQVDTKPGCVVEFLAPTKLISLLFEKQKKPEDGCMSHGLGHAAGKTLPLFNAWLGQWSATVKAKPGTVGRIIEGASQKREGDDDDDDDAAVRDVQPELDFLRDARAFRCVTVKRRIS